jgi:RNA polymerase sigma-70 factor (ECF subfamily)
MVCSTDLSEATSEAFDPQAPLIREANISLVREAIEDLPAEFREVVVLRELEDLSYKQIAQITDVPIGTVMSRLSRARQRLEEAILSRVPKEEV